MPLGSNHPPLHLKPIMVPPPRPRGGFRQKQVQESGQSYLGRGRWVFLTGNLVLLQLRDAGRAGSLPPEGTVMSGCDAGADGVSGLRTQ